MYNLEYKNDVSRHDIINTTHGVLLNFPEDIASELFLVRKKEYRDK